MKISVMPNFLRNHIRRQQGAKAELQAVLQLQQLIDQRQINVPYRFAMPREGLEYALGASATGPGASCNALHSASLAGQVDRGSPWTSSTKRPTGIAE